MKTADSICLPAVPAGAVAYEILPEEDPLYELGQRVFHVLARQLNLSYHELRSEIAKIYEDTCLHEQLGIDSLDRLDLIMGIEDEFDIEIPDEKVEGFRTVGDVISYIAGKVLSRV